MKSHNLITVSIQSQFLRCNAKSQSLISPLGYETETEHGETRRKTDAQIMNNKSIESSPRSTGRKELLLHVTGKPITRMQAMAAKCFECCNGYIDGQADCKVASCPLYPWMPYAKVESDSDTEIKTESTDYPL